MKEKIMKFLVVVFMTLTFFNVLLPDEFVIGILKLPYRANVFEMLIRWFNFVAFITLPIAVFFKRDTFKKISVYFCLPVVLIFTFMFPTIIKGYTSSLGTGIVDMRILPEVIATIMRNGVFRSVIFFGMVLSEIAVIVLMLVDDLKFLKFNKADIKSFAFLLPCLILSIIPIYAPEELFNTHTDLIFLRFSWMHILWIVGLILEAVILCLIFRKRSEEDRYILVLILSLCLLIQYNQLFSSLGELTIERLPLMLCNVAAIVTVISIAFKNKGIYLFNILINVVGGIIALIVLDVETPNGIMGILSKDNMHYIFEHNNVILIPILCLVLRVFTPFEKESLYKGIEQAVHGKRIGDIGSAVQTHCEANGFGVVREFVGHGIGRNMHESPEVPNYGRKGNGLQLRQGMCIAIEPMITLGKRQIFMERDGWTVRTRDRKNAAHFEHTVAVGKNGADILSSFEYVEEVLRNKGY